MVSERLANTAIESGINNQENQGSKFQEIPYQDLLESTSTVGMLSPKGQHLNFQSYGNYNNRLSRPAGAISQSHAEFKTLEDGVGRVKHFNLANVDGYFEKIQNLNRSKFNTPNDKDGSKRSLSYVD